jgi:hypothetical protein
MSLQSFPPSPGTFICDICGRPGVKRSRQQKRHDGECKAEARRGARGGTRENRGRDRTDRDRGSMADSSRMCRMLETRSDDQEAKVNGDELAALMFAEQRYLVLGSTHPLTIGSVVSADKGARMSTPLRVIAKSSRAEWNKQGRLAERISGGEIRRRRDCPAEYFYRVEAVD